jgi:hypothetical protein
MGNIALLLDGPVGGRIFGAKILPKMAATLCLPYNRRFAFFTSYSLFYFY